MGARATKRRPKAPVVLRSRLSMANGSDKVVVHELHCVGACTGLKFKYVADEQALGVLYVGKRTFDLAPDPLKSVLPEEQRSDCTGPGALPSMAPISSMNGVVKKRPSSSSGGLGAGKKRRVQRRSLWDLHRKD